MRATTARPPGSATNPDPELKSGIVILYDAEVEDLDVDGDLESGAGLGCALGDESGRNGVDVLVWGYRSARSPTPSSWRGRSTAATSTS